MQCLKTRKLKFFLCIFFFLSCTKSKDYRLIPIKETFPTMQKGDKFIDYQNKVRNYMRKRLKPLYKNGKSPYIGNLTLEQKVKLSSPLEFKPQKCKPNQKPTGLLMMHGLKKDSYNLSHVAQSIRKNHPCSLIRLPLLTGHGTVPGDSLSVSYKDWIKLSQLAVNSFEGEVNGLYLVGYSTGGALAVKLLELLKNNKARIKIKGVILFSPGFKSTNKFSFLAPVLPYFKNYMIKPNPHHPFRYSTVSYNLYKQVYNLMNSLSNDIISDIPLIVFSSDIDKTVDVNATINYFCKNSSNKNKKLILFKSEKNKSPSLRCKENIEEIDITKNHSYKKIHSFSHANIVNPPYDKYFNHTTYYCGNKENLNKLGKLKLNQRDCLNFLKEATFSYEHDAENKILRSTINPLFDEMINKINVFIDDTRDI